MNLEEIERHLSQFPGQCMHAAKLAREYFVPHPDHVHNIVVCGMGHAALAGDLLKSYYNIDKAVFVNKGYDIPAFVNKNSLVFIISYDGNTEETINAYRGACRRKAQVVCITSGGKLGQLCQLNSTDMLLVPKGIPEEIALGYYFIPLLVILENAGLLTIDGSVSKVSRMLTNQLFQQKGKELAQRLQGKVPLIYTSGKFRSIGFRWCHMLNKVAKTHAFADEFPNARYTSILGFENNTAPFEVVLINGQDDYSKVKGHLKKAKQHIAQHVGVTEIAISGDSHLAKLLSTIYLGDWVAYYLAKGE